MNNEQSNVTLIKKEMCQKILLDSVEYHCVAHQNIDKSNQFLLNEYDFDDGFYQGNFSFVSPLSGLQITSTPEIYGRHRLVASLCDQIDKTDSSDKSVILDLGCGNLNIARLIPSSLQSRILMANSDISGPMAVPDKSALQRGTKSLIAQKSDLEFINIQYDFNQSDWPFKDESVNYIVSCMALHHIRPERKSKIMSEIYSTLISGGSMIVVDVFQKDDSGFKFTDAGKRGPGGCEGHISSLCDFLDLAFQVGFKTDPVAMNLFNKKRNILTREELDIAVNNVNATLAINKAAWFVVLTKS